MKIMDLMLDEVRDRLSGLALSLDVNAKAQDLLMQMGYDVIYGARPLRRTIQKEIEDPLSVAILQGRFEAGDSVLAEVRSGKISFRRKNRRKKTLELPEKTADENVETNTEKLLSGTASENTEDQPKK